MFRINWLACAVCMVMVCVSLTSVASAAITVTGDIDPADPNTWTSSTYGFIGKYSTGTVTVNDGSGLLNEYSTLGHASGSTGTATVTGTDSTWTNSGYHLFGYYGNGTLNIEAGGQVSSSVGYLGIKSGSTGTVTVTGPGSTWMNEGHHLYVGVEGNGTLNIQNGGAVLNTVVYLGQESGSTGTATVTGAGSKWTNSKYLHVGFYGSGTLNIEAGGQVSNTYGYLGYYSGSTGTATVTGAGSKWTNSYSLYVGSNGTGTLNITDGGLVSTGETLTIDNDSDGDSSINMATGGMLALNGNGSASLVNFLELINGTDAIRYWDDSILDWADINGATYGEDYTLRFLTEGSLAGYTILTVPEPATLVLLMMSNLMIVKRWRW